MNKLLIALTLGLLLVAPAQAGPLPINHVKAVFKHGLSAGKLPARIVLATVDQAKIYTHLLADELFFNLALLKEETVENLEMPASFIKDVADEVKN